MLNVRLRIHAEIAQPVLELRPQCVRLVARRADPGPAVGGFEQSPRLRATKWFFAFEHDVTLRRDLVADAEFQDLLTAIARGAWQLADVARPQHSRLAGQRTVRRRGDR